MFRDYIDDEGLNRDVSLCGNRRSRMPLYVNLILLVVSILGILGSRFFS